MQSQQASLLPRHPLNFVLLNRVALDRPDLFPTSPAQNSKPPPPRCPRSTPKPRNHPHTSKENQHTKATHHPRPASAPGLRTRTQALSTQRAQSAMRSHSKTRKLPVQGTPEKEISCAHTKGEPLPEEAADVEARVASVIAALFSASSQDAAAKQRRVLARLRARPGSGGSPCKSCDYSPPSL
jgi:hypothetical protein